MRSSRSAPDPLDPGPAGFAHRGLHDGATFIENSLLAFAAALERGAGIECDLRLTADEQIIVFHDADALRLCGSHAIIARSTLADLSRFSVSSHAIPTLGQLLALVDGRVPLLLEAKVDQRFWRFGPALVAALDGYRGRCGVMSFDARLPRWLKTNTPHIRRGLVIAERLSPLRRWFAMKLADPDFVAVDRAALGRSWVERVRRRLPVYSWTIRTAAERATAAVHADALIWEADGRP
ncbi:MAG: glycerophosphodiester phosphodiesterase [Sphingomonas bacterium]|nr:glycerophosphodiester phosphodiesterase [Sphingomonas bacterium]